MQNGCQCAALAAFCKKRKTVPRSRQRKYGGGKFKSEQQRQYMWACYPRAAKKWSKSRKTNKGDWVRKCKPGLRAAKKGGRK